MNVKVTGVPMRPRRMSKSVDPRVGRQECVNSNTSARKQQGWRFGLVSHPWVVCQDCSGANVDVRPGRLGVRSAARLASVAYWASWANCLSQVHARAPKVCKQLLKELEGPPSRAQCSGSPTRFRSPCSRRHGGARVGQILGPSLPRPAAHRSRGGRADSWERDLLRPSPTHANLFSAEARPTWAEKSVFV